MTAETLNTTPESSLMPASPIRGGVHIVHNAWAGVEREAPPDSEYPRQNRLFQFVSELRRRRVCRAVTMYSVAMWLVCQIVELVSPELGLPAWTLKFVIMLGLLGLPVALILSWLLEITPQGLVVDGGPGRTARINGATGQPRQLDRVIDCSLVLLALIIAVQLAVGVLTKAPVAVPVSLQKIAVLPFHAVSAKGAERMSEGLLVELQHELASQTGMTVIIPRDPYLTTGSISLTGSVAIDATDVRVTATMIDNDSGVVTWSRVFERSRSNSGSITAELARDIVASLPLPQHMASTSQVRHAT